MGRHALRGLAVAGAIVGLVLAMAGQGLASTPLTQVSQDPYTNPSSYHQTQVEPDTFAYGSTIVGVFQTGRFPDGGSDDTGWATSTNGGQTWTNGFLPGTTQYSTPPGPWARISDPTVAYDPKDGVWMAAGLALDQTITGKAVIVNRSTDGLTWQNPVTVSQGGGGDFYDKDWITCDTWTQSPNYGNCYVEWDNANDGNQLMMSYSTDGGQTWTASTTPSAAVIGGQPLAQPNGNVVVPIANAFGADVESFVSTNGGVSYTGPYTVANMQVHGANGMRDGSGLPSAEVDGTGRVYVAWNDCRFRPSCSADDIVFSTSTDGVNWTPVRRVPIVATSSSYELFLPGIGVDRATGGGSTHIGLTFYAYPNASCSVSTCKLYAGFVSSTNSGRTWSRARMLFGPIQLPWLPNAGGYFVGDYISTSIAGNGRAYPVIANATAGTCTLGQITSCHEFMVSPTGGLAVTGGSHAATSGGAAFTSSRPWRGTRTAF